MSNREIPETKKYKFISIYTIREPFAATNKKRGNVRTNITCSVNVTIVGVKRALSITYSVCGSVVLVIWHVKRIHYIRFSSVAFLAVPFF